MISTLTARLDDAPRLAVYGRVTRVAGLVLEATGLDAPLGEICRIAGLDNDSAVLAEVVGFHERGVLLMPFGALDGVHPGSAVEPIGRAGGVGIGSALLGRVINALGEPIDGKGPINFARRVPLAAEPVNPLRRPRIDEPLVTGVRAIDGLLTMGRGQRVGIFAGSGVGKSTLLGMIARGSSAEVNVIALLGERGREVRDFVERSLGAEGLARSVVIVATSDEAALLRARGALVATAIAEHFRAEGRHVLLMVDSITRVAMAWREIGLAVGEPPTTKGYPPSVFAALPRLLERAGSDESGAISGLYTVLVEGDDFNEPVADAARSILDGHIVLTRRLATAGHFPSIDVLESVSRTRDDVIDSEHRDAANALQRMLAAYREREDLLAVGAYQAGADPLVDRALALREPIMGFLQQDAAELTSLEESREFLTELAAATLTDERAHA